MSIVDTAVEIASFLDDQRIPYAVIGGLAVQYWGEARTTRDVDLVVFVTPDKLDSFFNTAIDSFKPRLSDAVSFAQTKWTEILKSVSPDVVTEGKIDLEKASAGAGCTGLSGSVQFFLCRFFRAWDGVFIGFPRAAMGLPVANICRPLGLTDFGFRIGERA
jgi:hypothetical protein